MYLSRLILNPKARDVQYAIANCHRLHQDVMSAFSRAPAGVDAREYFGVLYRLDVGRQTGGLVLLVQSRVEPDWRELPMSYLIADAGVENPAVKEVSGTYANLRPRQILFFRLRANVTRRVGKHSKYGDAKHDETWEGKRVEVWGEERQLAWLFRKGKAAGFEVLNARVDGREIPDVRSSPQQKAYGRKAGAERRLTFGGVTFDGVLRVTDADALRAALVKGIGPAKAYGFGLLSLASAR